MDELANGERGMTIWQKNVSIFCNLVARNENKK